MEDEIKAGFLKFKEACQRALPGVELVIPTRSTQANFLISLTQNGQRTYTTIHEDELADWGEGNESSLAEQVSKIIQKLQSIS